MATVKMNVSVNYNEGLYYVDYKDIYMYHEIKKPANVVPESKIPAGKEFEYEYDADMTQVHYESFRKKLAKYMTDNFPSMESPKEETFKDKRRTKRLIASNKLFEVILEDNIWSVAVELKLVKGGKAGLQTQMFPSFLNGLRKGLFEQFETIHVRDGSWSSIPIDSSAPADTGNKFINPELAYENPLAPVTTNDTTKTPQPAYAYAENK